MENRRKRDPVKEELIKIKTQLEDHLIHFERHEREEKQRHVDYVRVQKDNTKKIDALISQSTDLLSAWQTAEGAVKFGVVAGRFVKWIGGFAVLVAVFDWFHKNGS